MRPFIEQVQSHYDLSDDFFELFLDSTRTYSCAYFGDANTSLEEAQKAKIDLSLRKCELAPGMKLLDIGCGWGSTALRAAEREDEALIAENPLLAYLNPGQYVSIDRGHNYPFPSGFTR